MVKRRIAAVVILALAVTLGAGAASAATRTVVIRVQGMTCEGCAREIEKALKGAGGVEDARVSFERGEAWIKYDDRKITVARLREVINGTGYKAVGVVTAGKSGPRRGKRRSL